MWVWRKSVISGSASRRAYPRVLPMTALLSVLLLTGCGESSDVGQATSDPNPGAVPGEAGGVEEMVTLEEAEAIGLEAVGEGRVTWSGPEDDRGAAWEVEVTRPDGSEVDVLIAPDGSVVR